MRLMLKARVLEQCGSQRRAAYLLKISEQRLSRIISGVEDPRPTELASLGLLLGETVGDDLLQRVYPPLASWAQVL
jgi:hypothetical protein